MALQYVSQTDPAVADAMRQELARERDMKSLTDISSRVLFLI